MKVSTFTIGTFVLQLALGNLCMMPMAMAKEIPDMHAVNHGMTAMTSHQNHSNNAEGMPCDGEHCFTHALPLQISLSTDGALALVLPTTPDVIECSLENETPTPISTAPPGQCIHVQTIVLRN